jgi:hypothetical protein
MCIGGLPRASTPLWQLAQLPVTPAWDKRGRSTLRARIGGAAVVLRPAIALSPTDAFSPPIVIRGPTAAGFTTVAIVVRGDAAGAAGGGFFCAAPPPQPFVLWQLLQSLVFLLPELWSLGRVVKLLTP